MRSKVISVPFLGIAAIFTLLLMGAPGACAADGTLKFEALLIWGTNDGKSPDPNHKPVEPEILKKLKELPLKWTNFFEVKRKAGEVRSGVPTKVNLSKECDIEVRLLPQSTVEVLLIGKGTQVLKGSQALPKGETLVLAGNAPNYTAWLVVLRRID